MAAYSSIATASTRPARRIAAAAGTAVSEPRASRTASSTVSDVLTSSTADTTAGGAPVRLTVHSGTTRVSTVACRASTADAPLTARNGRSRSAPRPTGRRRPRRGRRGRVAGQSHQQRRRHQIGGRVADHQHLVRQVGVGRQGEPGQPG
ncbi:hypothetical protein, partial [Micromonospora sp. 4G55]|uniref:hypothetical protein n=1 Tax=Micromonospora sp. 4G55 TaxID=2806102 RepID=UPI001A58E77C